VSEVKRALRTSVATVLTAGVLAAAVAVPGAQAASTPGWRFVAFYPQANMWSVSAASAVNAWTIGQPYSGGILFVTHWNGRRWHTIGAPGPIGEVQFAGASLVAVPGGRAIIFVLEVSQETVDSWVDVFEWTGRSWSERGLLDVLPGLPSNPVASGPGDVWAFGGSTPSAYHFDGAAWSQVPVPVVVSQASGNAAAGDWITGTAAARPTRVELRHWTSGGWRNAVLPKIAVPRGDQMFPGAVDAATASDIWVTVRVGPSAGRGAVTAVLLHWNGKAWSKAAVPKGASPGTLASDGHGGAWLTSSQPPLVIYHYSGGRWTHAPGPAKSGCVTPPAGLEQVPGTRSVLAVTNPSCTSGLQGAILKYGP
jgi:hypothetical protein